MKADRNEETLKNIPRANCFRRNSNKYSSLPANLSKKFKASKIKTKEELATPSVYSSKNERYNAYSKRIQTIRNGECKNANICKQPYEILDESLDDVSLSINLSSESIKNSCELYEDIGNDYGDIVEHSDNQAEKCSIKKVGNNILMEELNVLNELDAILETHDTSQSKLSGIDYEDKIQDCLMDLDIYLEKIDKSSKSLFDVEALENTTFHKDKITSKSLTLPKRKVKQSAPQIEKLERSQSFSFVTQKDVLEFLKSNSDRVMYEKSNAKVKIDSAGDLNNQDVTDPLRLERTEQSILNTQGDVDTADLNNSLQILTEEQIMNILLENESRSIVENRPRQFGRRGENSQNRVLSLNSPCRNHFSGTFDHENNLCRQQNERSLSAPANCNEQPSAIGSYVERNYTSYNISDVSSLHSSHAPSPITVSSVSTSSETIESQTVISDHLPPLNTHNSLNIIGENNRCKNSFNSVWPNGFSRSLALLCCTLGLFNMCRFAVLSVNYGVNFLVQFALLSILFGIPLFWLQMCLGAKIKAGPISMWKISPICAGVGVALILIQLVLAVYSTVCIAWILVYLRDIIPTKNQIYRWEETVYSFKHPSQNVSNLTENVADYFNILVLQRIQLANRVDISGLRFRVNDRLAFYLAFIWTAVFLIICKGLKSYGKILLLLGTVPLISLIVVTTKFVFVVNFSKLTSLFSGNELHDFLMNSKTWGAAAQETFLTWGLMGASIIALTSKSHHRSCETTLRKESIFVVIMTFIGLSTAAVLGLCCKILLNDSAYIYVPGSFERQDVYAAVYSLKSVNMPKELVTFPKKLLPHYSSVVGDIYRRPDSLTYRESGYQALRLITELYPAAVAIANEKISWIWTAVALSSFALLGLGQLCIMWKPISSALGDSTSSVLLSCVTGLILSIPFATEMGIYILYYIDFLFGGSWIVPILWTALIFGVFLVRGRPYNGDDLVNDLHMCGFLSAFLALSWNVLLPIGLISLSTVSYKISFSSQFYYWRGKAYFSYWSRKLGSLLQIGFLLLVPIISIIQIYRYLTIGPPDILDRIQNLYRPPVEGDYNRRRYTRTRLEAFRSNLSHNQTEDTTQTVPNNDAPPKYTPPPSYTTATGARLAKTLRHSIRRSVRRLLGDPERIRPPLPSDTEANCRSSSSFVNRTRTTDAGDIGNPNCSEAESIEISQMPINITLLQRSFSVGRKVRMQKQRTTNAERRRPSCGIASNTFSSYDLRRQRPYTAHDVVQVLRSSSRNTGFIRNDNAQNNALEHSDIKDTFRSIETLIINAEPPGQSPAIASNRSNVNETNISLNNEPIYNNDSVI